MQRKKKPKGLISGNSYESRSVVLRELGFSSYREYLASDLWKEIRRRVYQLKGSSCFLCGNQAQALHHNRYHRNDLAGKRLKYINPICHACHEQIEFRDGEKATVRQARSTFKKKRKCLLRGA